MMAYPDKADRLPDHEDRMRAARERAAWEIGDPSWAAVIINAYFDPASDHASLLREMFP